MPSSKRDLQGDVAIYLDSGPKPLTDNGYYVSKCPFKTGPCKNLVPKKLTTTLPFGQKSMHGVQQHVPEVATVAAHTTSPAITKDRLQVRRNQNRPTRRGADMANSLPLQHNQA